MIPERMKRVNETCKEALGEILQEDLKDPRLGFVTVTKVEVSPDLKQAKVWVSVLGGEEEAEETFRILDRAKGFHPKPLRFQGPFKVHPSISFLRDRGAEISEKVQMLLNEVSRGDEAVGEQGEGLVE